MKKLFHGKMMILLIVVMVLGGGGGGGFFLLPMITHSNPLASALGASETPAPTPTEPPGHKQGMMYPLTERVVNLGDTGGYRYLKIGLALEFEMPGGKELKGEAYTKAQETFAKEMASSRPIMDDVVTTVLAGKTSTDLAGLQGKETLREELKSKFSQIVGEQKLLNVYFTQFIIQ